MKQFTKFVAIVAVVVLGACGKDGGKHEGHEMEAGAEWAALDSFHMIMAESFHPYKDSANLEPARRLAPELAAEAVKWSSAEFPEGVDREAMTPAIAELVSQTKSFTELVATQSPDSVTGAALTKIHDQFHSIQEKFHGKH